MKKCVWIIVMIIFIKSHSYGQTQEAKQLLLDVGKLVQLKNILMDLKKGYEIVSGGYTAIKNISEGNFNLHNIFLSSLLEVSPAVKKYKRIADIVSTQLKIVSQYKSVLRQLKASGKFTIYEITYIQNVYSNLFNQSLKNLDALATIVTAGKMRMSDDERLSAIDNVWKEVDNEYNFLQHFNNQAKVLALQRAKEQNDISTINQLYNVNQ
ncbi:TerB family tellurite resistance protein [Ginsengibacter hankyongi]|uniref:TerB family tellurite resistance protein n=1 Tax=Ginsengibacter hankyongi TaxID=2607284 RepID=A0A5J5IHF8_9BACT|nr:TerB family tellurite resistance protein [Ginsengibacter hankyongi]KAA9038696.1 TerB family tellurite resistance protein [Ginsengibacter hankyongi]